MSGDQDAGITSDQESQDSDQLNHDDAGGLFGSGSEDQDSG